MRSSRKPALREDVIKWIKNKEKQKANRAKYEFELDALVAKSNGKITRQEACMLWINRKK